MAAKLGIQDIHPAQRMSIDLRQMQRMQPGAGANPAFTNINRGGEPNESSSTESLLLDYPEEVGLLRYSALPMELSGWVLVETKPPTSGTATKGKLVRQYFVLERSLLNLFNSEMKPGGNVMVSAPLTTIDMRVATIDVGSRDMEIVIQLPDQARLSFFAETQESLEQWFYCLKRARNSVAEFYEIGKVIGKGAFGSVMIARDRLTGELCVVKQMTKQSRSRRQLDLIQREMHILRRIKCHYVVRLFDIFNSDVEVCLVMELMRGGELYDLLSERTVFTEDIACHITNQVLEALRFLHAKNIVHRDLKPENILLESRNAVPTVKLTDFGLSNLLQSGLVQENLLNSVVGSLLYVAPELLSGQGYDYSVDIWAVGVILYALLSGHLPFNIQDKKNYERFLQDGPLFLEETWSKVSNLSKWFIRALLQVDPQKRLTAIGALHHPWIEANPYRHLIVPDPGYYKVGSVARGNQPVSRPLLKLRAAVHFVQAIFYLLRIVYVRKQAEAGINVAVGNAGSAGGQRGDDGYLPNLFHHHQQVQYQQQHPHQ